MIPLFIDLETRSTCDLKEAGGWNYAQHPTTKLLTCSWSPEPDVYYLWLPTVDEWDLSYLQPPSEDEISVHLPDVRLLYGPEVPQELLELTDRTWVAHNAMTFDKPVWEALYPHVRPAAWDDSYPRALTVGLPGGLNAIGKVLWGEGKYQEESQLVKKAFRAESVEDADPRNAPVAVLVQVGRYNVQDVRLLRWTWDEVQKGPRIPATEEQVLQAHYTINQRGAKADTPLLGALSKLSTDCRTHALSEIARLTKGELSTQKCLNSRTKVFAWLKTIGVNPGPSLKKEIIQRYIERNTRDEDEDEDDPDAPEDDAEVSTKGLALGLKVLELRMSAMKITDSKLLAAQKSVDVMKRIRFLFAYWAAHTGRWAGRRLQVHNLPKPKEGVPVWDLLHLFEEKKALPYEDVRALLPLDDPLYRFLSVDDAASALIRSVFVGEPLAMADLANIECRVLAWLAGEDWLLQTFWTGADPYMSMAERVFGKKETWQQFPDPKNPGKNLPIKKHPYRQAGKVIELGSGFRLGEVRLAMYFVQNGVDIDDIGSSPRVCTHAYRDSHPAICGEPAGEYKGRKYYRGGFWDQLNDAALAVVATRVPQVVGKLTFEMHGPHMTILLPSGRRLVYRNARTAMVTPSYAKGTGKKILAVQFRSQRFGWKDLHGGLLAENVTQAVARDFLAHAIVQLEEQGMPVVLHVHDEAVSETEDLERFMIALTTPPPWAPDFPLEAEGNLAKRYAKSPPPGVKEVVYRNGRMV